MIHLGFSIPGSAGRYHRRFYVGLVSYGLRLGAAVWFWSQCGGRQIGCELFGLALKLEQEATDSGRQRWLAHYRQGRTRSRAWRLRIARRGKD